MVERLAKAVDGSEHDQGGGMSRGGFVARMTLTAAALTVAPIRFLTRPVSAHALTTCTLGGCTGHVVTADCPGDCSGSQSICFDGYATFCCTINGGSNSCPSGTIVGGWWKCTNYTGSGLCNVQNIRYYLDCNAFCTQCTTGCTPCTGNPSDCSPNGNFGSAVCCPHCDSFTCQCASGSCGNRRTACNKFRYGQCNNTNQCLGPVVCRIVSCAYPPSVPSINCSSVLHVDDNTCCHGSSCLPASC